MRYLHLQNQLTILNQILYMYNKHRISSVCNGIAIYQTQQLEPLPPPYFFSHTLLSLPQVSEVCTEHLVVSN